MVLPQVNQILVRAGLWRWTRQVLAVLAETHWPIGNAHRGPEDRRDAKACFQAAANDMGLLVFQPIRHASCCAPCKWARLEQTLVMERRALIDDERAIVGQP